MIRPLAASSVDVFLVMIAFLNSQWLRSFDA